MESVTWSELGKQNIRAKKVYSQEQEAKMAYNYVRVKAQVVSHSLEEYSLKMFFMFTPKPYT